MKLTSHPPRVTKPHLCKRGSRWLIIYTPSVNEGMLLAAKRWTVELLERYQEAHK